MAERVLLSGLDDTKDMWGIVVRVMRKWKMFHKGSPNDLLCVCFLLIDAEVSSLSLVNISHFMGLSASN